MSFKKIIYPVAVLLFGAACLAAPLRAGTYDRYATLYRQDRAPSGAAKIANEFLTYPFELLRWPMDRGLVFFEKHHLEAQGRWIYDEIRNRGLYPHVGGFRSYGLDVDFIQLADQKMNFPDLKLKSGVHWDYHDVFQVTADAGWQDLGETGVGPAAFFSYESRPEEHFYGIGPNTSAGDGASYKAETTTVGTRLDYNPNPTIHGDVFFSYRNVNITNGEDGGRNVIDKIFPAGSIPGLAGDELLDVGINLMHDTRNHKGLSDRGGLRRFGFGYHEGLGSSDSRYLKYQTEISQYFRLWSNRRVLAVRFFGEHNDGLGGHGVPFHQMAKLGGFGLSTSDTSETLRGFDENRFFGESAALLNLEYRYAIYEYREFRLDAVFFWDEGQVFQKFRDFRFSDFRESYGTGFRLSVANHMLVSAELAHGDEGTQFYVKTRTPF